MLIASLILLQVILFSGLIYMLRRMITQNVVSATRHLEDISSDYDSKEQELNEQLQTATQTAQDIVGKAQTDAAVFKEQTEKQLEIKEKRILDDAKAKAGEVMQQAEQSGKRLISEIEDRIRKGALNNALELMHTVVPEDFKKIVHQEWMNDLINNNFLKNDRLHVPEEAEKAKVVSAFALTAQQKKDLNDKLKEFVGHDIELEEAVDPGIVAGAIVSVGSLVLDGSLISKMQEEAEKAKDNK